VRDIYELIREREADVERFQKEIERAQKELEALRLSAKLLDDTAETRLAAPAPTPITRDSQGYGTSSPRPATTPAATATPWASAKQFP
jgi:hypothetical protein